MLLGRPAPDPREGGRGLWGWHLHTPGHLALETLPAAQSTARRWVLAQPTSRSNRPFVPFAPPTCKCPPWTLGPTGLNQPQMGVSPLLPSTRPPAHISHPARAQDHTSLPHLSPHSCPHGPCSPVQPLCWQES